MFDKIKQAVSGAGDSVVSDGLGGYGQYLRGVDFPIRKDDLILKLRDNGADDGVIQHVESLASDTFGSAQEVFATLLPRE